MACRLGAAVLDFSSAVPVYDSYRAEGNNSGYHYYDGLSSVATVGFNWSNSSSEYGSYYNWTGINVSSANDLNANPSVSVYPNAGEKASYTSITGTDGDGVSGGNYAVWYGSATDSSWAPYPDGISKTEDGSGYIVFNEMVNFESVQIANTLVTSYYLNNYFDADGNNYSYEVIIYGLDANAQLTEASVRVSLSSPESGVEDQWITADLSSLNTDEGLLGLAFMTQTHDFGAYGANSPSYFALDNVVYTPIPEASTFAAIAGIISLLATIALKRKS